MRIPIGVEVSIDYDSSTNKGNWFKLTDHNRQPMGINYDLIQNEQRMANGLLRKYVVARKFKITTDWVDLPSIDSDLVDYKYGLAGQTNTTTVVVPTGAETTGTWTSMVRSYPSGYMTFYTNGTLPDRVGRQVNISGIPSTAIMKDGTYTVKFAQSALTANGTTSGSSTIVTLTNKSVISPISSGSIGVGNLVTGPGIPDNTHIDSVSSDGNTITLSKAVTLSNTPIVLGAAQSSFTVTVTPDVIDNLSGITGSYSFIANHAIVAAQVGTSSCSFMVSDTINDLPTVGQTITVYGATDHYNGTFVVSAVSGSTFSVPLSTTGTPPALLDDTHKAAYWIPGSHTVNSGSTTTVSVTNSNTAHGAAWIKAFYESNAFQPIWIKLNFAQETPVIYGLPDDTTYVDSQSGSQIFNAFMTSFSYDIKKRRSYTKTSSLNSGYDLVDLKIEFTEI